VKKILIVEDDKVVASAYQKKFTQDGFQVEWAEDGLEGIKMVSSVKPDIVLLDLLMPKLDGIEVLKFIRGHPDLKLVPVVVFSNSYMTNLVERAWNAGADQCLMKASTTPNQLAEVVNRALQKGTTRGRVGQSAPASAFVPPVAPLGTRPPAAPVAYHPSVSPVPPIDPLAGARSVQPIVEAAVAAAAVADEYPKAGSQTQPDTEFKAQVLQLFINHSATAMQAITALATAFVTDDGSSEQLTQLNELFHKVHSITANAAIAGCVAIAHFASTFEAFLKELQHKAKYINPSTLRTVANSVNFLAVLLDQATQPAAAAPPSPAILVVDTDPVSAQTVELALAKAELPITTLENPNEVLRVMGETRYDLVVIALDLAGLNGIELYTRMRTLTNHASTPVLLISTLNELDNHLSLITGAETDIIARPFLLMELTVKAVMQLQRSQMLQ